MKGKDTGPRRELFRTQALEELTGPTRLDRPTLLARARWELAGLALVLAAAAAALLIW